MFIANIVIIIEWDSFPFKQIHSIGENVISS